MYFFLISEYFPALLTVPSVTVEADGFSYITGCIYNVKEDIGVDLAEFFYLLINNQTKIKINGWSTRINFTTFQLPESRFIIPGKYQCLIEAPGYYSKGIISPPSAYIPMPGMLAKAFFLLLLNFLVTKSFEEVNNFNFIKAFTSGNA